MFMIAWYVDLQPLVQSVPITTKVVSSHSAHDDVYSMQYYVIQFVSDFRQVGGFLRGYTNKTDLYDIAEILMKVALRTITLCFLCFFCPFSFGH